MDNRNNNKRGAGGIMLKYIKLAIANLIVLIISFVVLLCISMDIISSWSEWFDALFFVMMLYNILYGIISCIKTKSVIFPNLILLGFIVAFFMYAILTEVIINDSEVLFDFIYVLVRGIAILLLHSLVPSIIIKIIMVLLDKRKKAKSTVDETEKAE